MSSYWFTESGTSGIVTINWVNDSWEVIQPETEGLVKCILKGSGEIPKSGGPKVVEGTVSRYAIGMDDDPNYLHLSQVDSQPQSTSKKSENDSQNETRTKSNLSEIEGNGGFIDVEATVKSVHAVNKNESGTPDIRGRLIDDNMGKSVLFVVENGVKHPYLEEGATFQFDNVQDYYHKGEDKVQVRITSRTNFTKVSGSDSSESNYSKKEADVSTGGSDKKVHTQRQESRDSTVGKAKERARRQGRDPAIDPHFQPDDR